MTAHQKDARAMVAGLQPFVEKPAKAQCGGSLPKASTLKRKRKMPGPTEAQIERACTQLLELDGWRALKTNPVSNRARGAGFGELGMADCLYIRYSDQRGLDGCEERTKFWFRANPELIWIEWKRIKSVCRETQATRATKAAAHQQDWHTLERKRGALTLIAGVDFEATIDDFKRWYLASGLNRRIIP